LQIFQQTGARNLQERTIGRTHKMGVGAIVPYRTVICDVGTTVWAEPDIGRAVEPGTAVQKRLVAGGVAGEPLDLECGCLIALLLEVDQLDLMTDFGRRCRGIRGRETKIALE